MQSHGGGEDVLGGRVGPCSRPFLDCAVTNKASPFMVTVPTAKNMDYEDSHFHTCRLINYYTCTCSRWVAAVIGPRPIRKRLLKS